MKRLLVVFISILATCQLCAQYTENQDIEPVDRKVYHGLGFVAGRTAGLGLAYQYHFNKWCFQGAFLPLKNSERELYNAGLSIMYSLVQGSSANLFVIQSNMYYAENLIEQKNAQGIVYRPGSQQSYWNHGVGIGVSTDGNAIRFYFSAGYGALKNFEEIDVTVDAGLFYHF